MDFNAPVIIFRGLEFGDEGKGTMVDYVASESEDPEVVRDGGGYQAAHYVVHSDGRWYCASQTGAGMFNSGVRAFLSKEMFIEPANLLWDHMNLQKIGIDDCMARLSIDSRCPIATPVHQMIGRMLEVSRGKNRHGSTGMGIGQAVRDKKIKGAAVLNLGDTLDEVILEEKIKALFSEKFGQAEMLVENNPGNIELAEIYRRYQTTLSPRLLVNKYRSFISAYSSLIVNGDEYFAELLESQKTIVFEGAQGALLDPGSGLTPYVTKTPTTFAPAEELLAGRVKRSDMKKIGIMRAYGHRHGAGPLVTEDENLAKMLPEMHNVYNPWQGAFRVGWFDLPAIRHGIAINREIDSIALTNLDRLSEFEKVKVCISYLYDGSECQELDDSFEWEYRNDDILITGFKKQIGSESRNGLADILFRCKPWEFKEFPGWQTGISNIKRSEDLPREARAYINFLASSEGADVPISVISVGPTNENKILYDPC